MTWLAFVLGFDLGVLVACLAFNRAIHFHSIPKGSTR